MSFADFVIYFDHINICQMNLSFKNSCINVTSNRYDFNQVTFNVQESGDYYFTIYQENPRKYKNSTVYHKSKSWCFLCQLVNGKIQAIGSSAVDLRDNTIEATLQKG
jgi:hypothetical protein